MTRMKLNDEWSRLMDIYQAAHQDPVNQACHTLGIPLIAASIPIGATLVGLPLALPMFGVGWTLQFVGHAFEGKQPSFATDRRHLLIGLLWWTKKMGLVETTRPAQASLSASVRGRSATQ
jgi:uncharacterized membrane protein YGL010W